MRLVLIAEDRVGFTAAKTLADRVLIECGPDWVDADSINSLRDWTGIDHTTPFTKWIELRRHPAFGRIRVHGRTEGPDYMAARQALALAVVVTKEVPIAAVVLVRDMDNQPDRKHGLATARDHMEPGLPFQVVIAAADPEGEAWILHGFCAETDGDRDRLAQIRDRLRFDPTLFPDRLRGDRRRDGTGAELDIKRVLSELTGSDLAREARCLESTPLTVLEERGGNTGLGDFLADVRARLLPIIDPAPTRAISLEPTRRIRIVRPKREGPGIR